MRLATKASGLKGNPASKRMSNANRKAKRERSWKKAQQRKVENKAEQQRREKKNKATKAAGGLTPHELSQQEHLRRRNARL